MRVLLNRQNDSTIIAGTEPAVFNVAFSLTRLTSRQIDHQRATRLFGVRFFGRILFADGNAFTRATSVD